MRGLRQFQESGLMKVFHPLCIKNMFQRSVRFASQTAASKQADVLDTMYSPEQRERIIDCFNRCSVEELRVTKQLNLAKASSIVKYRREHGDFDTLSGIIKVPGLGMLGLQKVCDVFKDFSYEAVQKLKQTVDIGSVKSHPPMSKIVRENINTLVAMNIQCDRVSWTWMDRNLQILDWKHSSIFEKHFQKYDHVIFLEKLHDTIKTLPAADIYVMESKILHLPNLRVAPFMMSLKLTEAILCTLLNKEFGTTSIHKVYTMSSINVSKFFGLSMGGERVSGQYIIREIRNKTSEIAGDVDLPESCWETYQKLSSIDQEKYANSLLLATAFYKLIILRTHYETGEKSMENETSEKIMENETSEKSMENETSEQSMEFETSENNMEYETGEKSMENETSEKKHGI